MSDSRLNGSHQKNDSVRQILTQDICATLDRPPTPTEFCNIGAKKKKKRLQSEVLLGFVSESECRDSMTTKSYSCVNDISTR